MLVNSHGRAASLWPSFAVVAGLIFVAIRIVFLGRAPVPSQGTHGAGSTLMELLREGVPTSVAANGEPNPVQRIFYFHVPSAFMTFLAVGIVFVCSILYLATRRREFDRVARASTELGMLFCSIVLVTGPIWAKPEWGHAWTWEPRLNLTAILWLIFFGSILVRLSSDNRDQAARFCSALGIVALPVVLMIYKSVELWGGIHPRPTILRNAPQSDLPIKIGFWFCLASFFALFLWLVTLRTRLGSLEERLEDLRVVSDLSEAEGSNELEGIEPERGTG